MDTFAILYIRAWLDAEDDKQTPHYQPHCSPKHWMSERAWHRQLMASEREKAGMALGGEKKESRVGRGGKGTAKQNQDKSHPHEIIEVHSPLRQNYEYLKPHIRTVLLLGSLIWDIQG